MGQQNILYNLPLAQQDGAFRFVAEAAAGMASNPLLDELLSGRIWLHLRQLYIQG